MDPDAKIVFIHRGRAWYLPYALHQARWASPGSDVVLLGQDHGVPGTTTVALDLLTSSKLAADFRRAYVHMSTNSEAFEFFCFQRWFCLLEYMQQHDIGAVFHFDSDTLLYSSAERITLSYRSHAIRGAFLVDQQQAGPMQLAASAHASYWTRDLLEDFCGFVVECYRGGEHSETLARKWQWHLATGNSGGVCDMTALYLFWATRAAAVANLALNNAGTTFDMNINCGSNHSQDEYRVAGGRKKVTFVGRSPMLERMQGEPCLVQAHTLHFQGGAKSLMPSYYTGPNFQNKARTDAIALVRRVIHASRNRAKSLATVDRVRRRWNSIRHALGAVRT